MHPQILISEVDVEVIYPVRQKVLRPGAPIEAAQFDCDKQANTFHLAAFDQMSVVGSASFTPEAYPNLQARMPYRLRGMATLTEMQGQGVGRQLLLFGEEELKRRQCDLLWFNAREKAFVFYEKLGYVYLGDLFDIPGIGLHKVMYKYI